MSAEIQFILFVNQWKCVAAKYKLLSDSSLYICHKTFHSAYTAPLLLAAAPNSATISLPPLNTNKCIACGSLLTFKMNFIYILKFL